MRISLGCGAVGLLRQLARRSASLCFGRGHCLCYDAWVMHSFRTPPDRFSSLCIVIAVSAAMGNVACLGTSGSDPCAVGQEYLRNVCYARPTIIAHVPAVDALDVVADAPIVVTFSLPMDPALTGAALSLVRADTGAAVSGVVTWNSANTELTWTPTARLEGGVQHTLILTTDAQSVSGAHVLERLVYSFTVQLLSVTVTSLVPADQATNVGLLPRVRVVFSARMQPDTVRAALGLRDSQGNPVDGDVVASVDGTRFLFTPTATLRDGQTYVITLANTVRGARGEHLASAVIHTFTTLANGSDSDVPELTVDPINVTVSTPDLNEHGEFVITGTAHDTTTAIAWVGAQVVAAGAEITTMDWDEAVVNDDGTWTYAWPGSQWVPLPDGAYDVHMMAVDLLGNSTQTTTGMIVDFTPPAVGATFAAPLPTTWKFKTLTVDVQGTPGDFVDASVNDVHVLQTPVHIGDDGVAHVNVLLGELGVQTVAVWTVDAEGNPSPDRAMGTVHYDGYTCLLSGNNFPAGGAIVLPDTLVDSLDGTIALTYRLDAAFTDDTNINSRTPESVSDASSGVLPIVLPTVVQPPDPTLVALFQFSNTLIPACASVGAARLVLTMNTTCDDCTLPTIDAYPLLRAWKVNQVSWKRPSAGVNWGADGASQVGVDREADVVAQSVFNEAGTTATFDITSLVQRWQLARQGDRVNGIANNGIVLQNSVVGSSLLFWSSDHSITTNHPRLELQLIEPR